MFTADDISRFNTESCVCTGTRERGTEGKRKSIVMEAFPRTNAQSKSKARETYILKYFRVRK
jgi:hypothetical protein